MDDRLRKIEERLAKVSPGPWVVTHRKRLLADERPSILVERVTGGMMQAFVPMDVAQCGVPGWETHEAHADFIAHARDDIPYLLQQLREAREVLHATAEAIMSVYPTIAGRVIDLKYARETVAHEHWAEIAKTLYDAGQKARTALEEQP